MIDAANQWILTAIAEHASTDSLWITDENMLEAIPSTNTQQAKIISNRFDIVTRAQSLNLPAEFSDFDFSHYADQSQQAVFYRISKEKPLVNHIINQATRLLKVGGKLYICGHKNEGIKSFIDKIGKIFDDKQAAKKNHDNYSAVFSKRAAIAESSLLDDQNYSELRNCLRINDQEYASKPGIFGWNKIDRGSQLLINTIEPLLKQRNTAAETCLDLGCGYGYLTLALTNIPFKKHVLTDNNAAALLAASQNLSHTKLTGHVIASDAGKEISEKFDVVLCNPPFHQGFSVDEELTHKFLTQTKRLLANKGQAFFVVNQFISLDKKAEGLFKATRKLTTAQGFSIFQLDGY